MGGELRTILRDIPDPTAAVVKHCFDAFNRKSKKLEIELFHSEARGELGGVHRGTLPKVYSNMREISSKGAQQSQTGEHSREVSGAV